MTTSHCRINETKRFLKLKLEKFDYVWNSGIRNRFNNF